MMKQIALLLIVLLVALPAQAGEENAFKPKGGFEVVKVELETGDYAYLEGTLFGKIDELFGQLVGLGMEQELIGEDTKFGMVYPAPLALGVDETTTLHAAFSLEEGAEVAAPLLVGQLEGGYYLRVQHWGDYMQLEETYTKFFMWAAEHGVEPGSPSFEYYVTDPETTPVEEWLTEIYFPVGEPAEPAEPADKAEPAEEEK